MHTVLQGGIFLSQTMEWHVKETFTFPSDFGCVKDVKSINVQANWECEQLLEELHIHGIYHIMAKVQFDREAGTQPWMGTMIEHVDLMEDEGYFEYALPFRLELPMMEVKSLRIEDIQTTCGNAFDIAWQVMCVYDEMTTTTVTSHEKILLEETAESPEKNTMEIGKEKAVERVMEGEAKEMAEAVAEDLPVPEATAREETEKMAVKMMNEKEEEEEPVEERLEEYMDEGRQESTEFLFHLEDGYRKQSFVLNKVRD